MRQPLENPAPVHESTRLTGSCHHGGTISLAHFAPGAAFTASSCDDATSLTSIMAAGPNPTGLGLAAFGGDSPASRRAQFRSRQDLGVLLLGKLAERVPSLLPDDQDLALECALVGHVRVAADNHLGGSPASLRRRQYRGWPSRGTSLQPSRAWPSISMKRCNRPTTALRLFESLVR
jgi:hypothetical protein